MKKHGTEEGSERRMEEGWGLRDKSCGPCEGVTRHTHRRASEQRHEGRERQVCQPGPGRDADRSGMELASAAPLGLHSRPAPLESSARSPCSRIQIPHLSRPHWVALRTTRSSHWLNQETFPHTDWANFLSLFRYGNKWGGNARARLGTCFCLVFLLKKIFGTWH